MRAKIFLLIATFALSFHSFSQDDSSATENSADKKDALLVLKLGANDSMNTATAIIKDAATGLPLKDVEVIFSVPRTFGAMQIGTGTTDTTGTASIEFPFDIRASDKRGLYTVVAKVEDDDNINNVAVQEQVKSKVPFPGDKSIPRSIIGSRAPWWLILAFWGAVGSIWFLFFYSVVIIYKIKNAKTHSLTTI